MKLIPYEIDEQVAVIEYLEFLKSCGKVVIFTALPNNTYTTSWSQKAKLVKEGVRKGYPDICVVLKDIVFFMEMKRIKGGTVSAAQKEWIKALESANVPVRVCKGFDEAKEWIDLMIRA